MFSGSTRFAKFLSGLGGAAANLTAETQRSVAPTKTSPRRRGDAEKSRAEEPWSEPAQGWGRWVWVGFVPRRRRRPVRLRLPACAGAGNLRKKARNPEIAMQGDGAATKSSPRRRGEGAENAEETKEFSQKFRVRSEAVLSSKRFNVFLPGKGAALA